MALLAWAWLLALALLGEGEATLAVGKKASDPPVDNPGRGGEARALHCCRAPAPHSLALACDAAPGDKIVAVPYAVYGAASEGSAACGQERDPQCGASVRDAIATECVGKRVCALKAEDFKNACPDSEGELRVRWVCRSDNGPPLDRLPAPSLPPFPLRANGSIIVDAKGQRVKMVGVTWGGFHIKGVPGGLDEAPIEQIARVTRELGFNVVRFTFSAQDVIENPIVEEARVLANPRLKNKRALEILDEVISTLAEAGLMVWLDFHMFDSDWCCSSQDCSGLWFNERYSFETYVSMWRSLARRYADTPALVGVGLKNEPRPVCTGKHSDLISCNVSDLYELAGGRSLIFGENEEEEECVWPAWGSGPEVLQYRPAMERVGGEILAENNNLLIGVSGLVYSQYLTEVAFDPVKLPKQNLVYEAHEYSWYRNYAAKGVFDVDHDPEGAWQRLSELLDNNWGYILRNGIAPVFVSEWGMSHSWEEHDNESRWFRLFRRYMHEGPLAEQGGLDWAYWQLTSVQIGGTKRSEGAEENFGILTGVGRPQPLTPTSPRSEAWAPAEARCLSEPGRAQPPQGRAQAGQGFPMYARLRQGEALQGMHGVFCIARAPHWHV
eukprot:CAMPEP_0170231598 /NCGR_PEP_ID=MMETSP0116_2-20130129/15534_1 /TAXON_ID=400756 /ORGANISM="Durinskia baltica, Strain CSIRO CS-38" /LENGTH=610 /DNA_ID=CAMNT_0010482371 /DNA_START=59 /DNA_END=1889 /DNA_ORIENTATION=-